MKKEINGILSSELKILIIVLTFFFLAGCAAVSPESRRFTGVMTPPAGESVVYIYRPFGIMGGADVPSIYHNGKKVLAGLPNRTYWRYVIKPGTHTFEPKILFGALAEKVPVTIVNKKPGKVYYVRLRFKLAYIGLEQVSQEQATPEIKNCFLVKE